MDTGSKTHHSKADKQVSEIYNSFSVIFICVIKLNISVI